ncbi:MAG: gliding motility-associated C-terminal domain-containing protein [Saprospiraceae bacterium]
MPNTVCNTTPNGSINITVTPPNAGYTFMWSNGATSEDLNGVAQGDYTVTVTLIGTCTQEATFTVPDNPNAPQITPTVVNTTCDFANGAINIAVIGGPTPYTYLWSPDGQTTQNLSSILAGSYQVTVTAANGCTRSADITVTNNNPPINLSATTIPNTNCNVNFNGSINLTAGPLTNYTYNWSNGATTQDLTNLPPGDYTVTVSAGGTCIEFATYTVPDFPNAPNTSVTHIDANCGLPNGSINLSVSGGVPPYTYAWSSGQTTQDLANITGGVYQVVVTGANGCTSNEDVVVDDNDIPIDINAVVVGKTSCVINNGTISLTVTPIAATVLWSTGSTSKNLVSLSPGSYTVTVSMGGTCTREETYIIDDESELPVLSADILPAICGFNNGSIDLHADFGIPPYTYDWAHIPGPNNPQDLNNLIAGNYVVTVTTSVGCTDVFFAPIDNEPVQIDIYFLPSDDLSCTSDNGFIDLDVEPMLNYTYDWQHIPGTNNPQDLNNLSAGTYSVTVNYGTCNASVSLDIYDATEPPSVSISNTAAICGQSNGTVTLNATGATAPYRFDWAHIPGANNPQNLSNLAPGTYNVTVIDFFDCTATATTTVVNSTIVLNITGSSVKNTSCVSPNGIIDISVLPTGTNYTYIWSTGATTEDLTGIAPGIYSVTASAGVGCTSVATFQVTNNTVDPILDPAVTAAICSQNNGNIQITTTSGTAPYNFLWSNAATTEDLNNIFPGNYSLTVTDANGCTADTTLNVANNATTFSLSATATDYSDCNTLNGAIDLTITPAGPYTYLWAGGETTQDLNNLPAGAYTVQVTELGTCIASATYFVQDVRTWPNLNQSIAAELCNLIDGSIDISIFGGLAPFGYAWSSGQTTEDLANIAGGTYTLTVTGITNHCSASITSIVPENDIPFSLTAATIPNSSCVVLNGSVDLDITPAVPSGGPGYTYIWSNGTTTQDLNPVSAGTYAVTVSAGGTCTNTASYVVDDAAGAPSIAGSISQALCGQSSGTINLGISGGAAPYTFIWSQGATTEDLANIPSGSYAVTVTGANGCQISDSYDVPEGVITPTLGGIPQPNTACVGPNGSINLSISPSTLSYTINWSTGATTQNLTNLTAGTYTVSVYGGGACTASATYIVDNASVAVTAGGLDVDVLCFGNSTGSIDLVTNGGTQPFVFNWNPGSIGNIEDPSGLAAGTYRVTITDAVGCSTTASFTITQPPNTVQAACAATGLVSQPGFNDGKAEVQISGGVAPYTVLWSPGGLQSGIAPGAFPLNNLGVGHYDVTVTDANGCTAICGFNILLSPCTSAVGTMGSAQISLCGTGCITANYDALGQVLDPDDILQFILHLGPDSVIVGEKARSNQPTFCFNPATMLYGTTYYVSAVVGNNNGSGNVVLSHYCTVIATGTPIVFYERPVASAAIPEPITCATLVVGVLGSSNLPNSTFLWSTINGTIIGNTNTDSIQANEAGQYTLVVNSNGCLDTTAAEVLDIRNDPTAKIVASPDDILDCIIDEIVLSGEVKGSGNANTIWYDQNGVVYPSGSVLQINIPGTYWFAIVDTVTFCTDTASIVIDQNQLYPPLFINPPGILTCAIGSVTLSGGSPVGGVQLQWATVVGQDTTIVGTGTSLVVTQPNTYLLIGFDPVNGCNNALSTVVVTDQTYPTAEAGPPFNIDCYGETLPINGSATGGSGTLIYNWTTSGGAIVSGANTLTPIISEPGTYTLVVTASGNGCSDTDVVIVDPNDPVAIPIVNNAACFGDKGSILIDTVLGAKPPIQYTLTGGQYIQSGNLFFNLSAGAYTIYIVDANGCATSVNATVTQPPVFEVTVDPQITVQLGESYQVDATVNIPLTEISQITWTPPIYLSCDTCLSTRIDTPLHTQAYRILVVNKSGCRDEAPLLVRVNKQVGVYIPNIFSPDNSDENNRFTVYADMRGVKQVKMLQIFDRWGNQVFQRENFPPNDPTLGWDGRFRGQDMNPAVFVYYAIVEFIDGQEVLYKGDVTVNR